MVFHFSGGFTNEYEVWLDEALRFDGLCVGKGLTREDALSDAVVNLMRYANQALRLAESEDEPMVSRAETERSRF